MICLTGDVHHSSLNSGDYQYLKGSEIESALEYAKIATSYGLKITLFFTGLCAKENEHLVKIISRMENVEIGGHNYFAFKPKRIFNALNRLFGTKHGPYWYQLWEVSRTVSTLGKVCHQPIVTWRDHAYRHDKNTRRIMKRNGIRWFSDVLSNDFGQPVWNDGVIDVPINTLPDHDYVYHGARQPGAFDEEGLLRTAFETLPISKEEWLERIKGDVEYIENIGGVTTILAHPACMEVFDEFETFGKVCAFLSNYETCKMKEIQVAGDKE